LSVDKDDNHLQASIYPLQDCDACNPIFTESKEGDVVGIQYNSAYRHNKMTHHQCMLDLKKIMPIAAKDYNLNKLGGLYMGNLSSKSDLAVDLTHEYLATTDEPYSKIIDYHEFSKFLAESQLGRDVNNLFEPYGIFVDKIRVEKVHFVSKDVFLQWNKVETDTTDIPNQILDCFIGISLSKY